MNERSAYWVGLAEYDLETARAMLETKRFLYVGFMCHQVVEKALKAAFVDAGGQVPPYSHDLRMLAQRCGIYEQLDESQKETLDVLGPLNVEARYPTQKERLLRTLDRARCSELIRRTEGLFQWIQGQLSNE